MDSPRLVRVASLVNMSLFLLVLVALMSSAAARGRYSYDDLLPAVERRGGNPA